MSQGNEGDERRIVLGRLLIARFMGVFKALGLYEWQHSGIPLTSIRLSRYQ